MATNAVLTLEGRTAVVTGGSRNIGFAIAERFASCGMSVAILSLRPGAADAASARIRSRGGRCLGVRCDVTDLASLAEAFEATSARFGGIDVLVNSAGVLDVQSVPEMTAEHWEEVVAVNLRGTFFAIQQALPYLEASPAPRIINISSNAGRMGGFENGMAYSASKGGVIALTYGLARQLAPKRITVNCIAPGTIESDMLRARDESARARLLARFPLGRFGTPDEVAVAACYFASEEAAFTTGAVLDVNGGLFMG